MPGLLEAVVEEPGNGVAVLDCDVDEQLVVEAQHDPCGQARAAGSHRHCPELEQLGGRTLDEGITTVAALAAAAQRASRVPTSAPFIGPKMINLPP